MGIVIIRQDGKAKIWKEAFRKRAPEFPVYGHLEKHQKKNIQMALVWKPPQGIFKDYPNLRCIASTGAGVDFLFKDKDLPENIPITRVVDEYLAKDMSEHVLAVILCHLKNLNQYKQDQYNRVWKPEGYHRIEDLTVGIMGLGALGKVLAKDLVSYGFKAQGWSNSKKNIANLKTYAGVDEQFQFLSSTQILVCLLPLTKETVGILDKDLFEQLRKGAFIVNVARGGHIVDNDLLMMIEKGHLSGASLDVYHQEPLPKDHPFWDHPKIHMTPHCASVSDPDSIVPQILENYQRLIAGKELLNLVSRLKGY
ncbi:MAG: glyoxylate/hydroxypyruvate reductase A [Maribacter sp.]|nr:glyoxylate/hydroxypyruvate reductase A [Maribacter sp.]